MRHKIILRLAAILLIALALGFSITWRPDANASYCIGDELLRNMGLKPWSNGEHGTHYTVLYGFGIMVLAFVMLALTAEHRLRSFLLVFSVFMVVFILANIVN